MNLQIFNKLKYHVLWLFLLLFLAISWSLYNFNANKLAQLEIQNNLELRVLELKRSGNFSYTYTVESNGSLFQLLTTYSLKVGSKVSLLIDDIKLYGSDSVKYQRYLYITGLSGELFSKSKPSSVVCDFYCHLIENRANILNNSYVRFSNLSCYEFKGFFIAFDKIPCSDSAALATGLVFGNVDQMSKDTRDSLTDLGLSHIIAVSGFQIVVIIAFFERILDNLSISKNLKIFSILIFCTVFSIVVGFEPPIVRALFSFAISIISLTFLGRKAPFYLRLVYSFALICFIFPNWLFSFSLQLSYLATIAVSLTPFNTENNYSLKNILFDSFISTILSFFITLPLILSLNSSVNILSVPLSGLISAFIPFVTAILVIGYLISPIGLIGLLLIQIVLIISNYLDFGIYLNLKLNQIEALMISTVLIIIIIYLTKTNLKSQLNSVFSFGKNIFNFFPRGKPDHKI